MLIKKLKVSNFKKFKSREFDFNDDINIIVGDNESGKSTLLEALELCLNLNYRGRPLSASVSTDLFNNSCVQDFLSGDKSQNTLPEILIEVFIDDEPSLKGTNNSEDADVAGLFVRIFFDPDLSDAYAEFIKKPDAITSLPIDFYTFEWFSFAWKKINYHSKVIQCLFVDPPRLHPTYGTQKYITDMLRVALTVDDRSILNLNYRQLKQKFDEDDDVAKVNRDLDISNEITNKNLEISVNTSSQTSWESNLQINLDSVPFSQIGKGEQHQVQIKLALWQKAKDTHVIMIEEPENHLSHLNLVKLIKYIEDQHDGQQVFLTTHSSYVLNKLSFEKLCLISNDYKRLNGVDSKTIKTLQRFPGYDTLRAVLSRKVILVEGPSDELVIKKLYLKEKSKLPEEDGIDVIVVRGIGFKNYLNIIMHLKHEVHVVKDNDGDYQGNIIAWQEAYSDFDFIKVFSPQDDNERSLEPSLIEANGEDLETLNSFAKIVLSTRTYNLYNTGTLTERKLFLNNWFLGSDTGSRKVDSAMRIFDSNEDIVFPNNLLEVINFDE